jgi:hypothetical protein
MVGVVGSSPIAPTRYKNPALNQNITQHGRYRGHADVLSACRTGLPAIFRKWLFSREYVWKRLFSRAPP